MIRVSLTLLEILQAANIGVARQLQALRSGSDPAHGAGDGDDWGKHIEGACGELAFAKVIDRYWTGATRRNAPDVGQWHVRTRSRHKWDLIIRSDDMEGRYVLVTGRNGCYVVRGWMSAGEAKQHSEWVKEYGGREKAWFVPQAHLYDISNEYKNLR